jgi:acyl-CoA hydrolase
MDICGAIAAMRFSNSQCVTASMDHVDFISPIELGEVVTIQAYAFDTGRTSIDIKVDVRAEEPRTGDVRETTSSFFTFVAVDEDGTPTEVPDLRCESDAERDHRDDAFAERRDQLASLLERMDEYTE